MTDRMTYAGVGVDYEAMDPFKRLAQRAGRETANTILRLGFSEVEMSRGESAYLMDAGDHYVAHVEEGLGTKNLVADAMYRLTGKSYYDHIAQCTVAMIVNDMITLGALPLSVAMHLAVGGASWFNDEKRSRDLIDGWKKACELARCAWGGGETPTLKDIVHLEAAVLSGSAVGVIKPKSRLINAAAIQQGDAIVLFGSSGIHANGLTLAREVAGKLPKGYLTTLTDGRTYGEALLDPTIIYVPFVEDCFNEGVKIHYAVNITGHGWRKLMRAPQSFAYIIEHIPVPQPVFSFIQEHGPVDDQEAYANFNMGAGFALYVRESDVSKVLTIASRLGISALRAGTIKPSQVKKVIIQPLGLEYLGSTLGVR
ncbi:MAG: phosphoribosylformylglycinamidine cyclo-ligase [Syntrophaceae bacterium]|nr:phosphoribosylformylglycinamidine cyclo-ligase [Syntrophaceae bacterium]